VQIKYVADTVLGETIGFMAKIGVYDVVLPFILVFTLFFAFLEKSKVLGIEVIKDAAGKEHRFTRKNLNAMIAFCAAFFVVASAQLVRIISEVIANTVILIVTGLCFMLAVGITHTGEKEFDLDSMGKGWKLAFWIVSAVGILLILFNALGWLDAIYTFLAYNWDSAGVATMLMILIFVGFMVWVTKPQKGNSDTKK